LESPENISYSVGFIGLTYLVIVLSCIVVSWWVLQTFRFDAFCRNPKGIQAKLLQILLSIALGYQVAKFIMDYIQWSMQLKWMF